MLRGGGTGSARASSTPIIRPPFMTNLPTTSSAADRLAPVRAADPVLRDLRAGALGFGFASWTPCAVAEVSCLLARYVALPSAHAKAVAVAVPRGRHHLAGVIAVYLGYARENEKLTLRGCIALATNDRDTKNVMSRVTVRKGPGRAPEVRRLVAGAVSRPMQGTAGSHGISQRDREVLIHLPSYQPRLPANVISVSVVDAVSCPEDSWEALRTWAVDGDRAQILVGELGDPAFAAFCKRHDIPMWGWDYGTLAVEEPVGDGAPSMSALITRARSGPPTIGYRVCDDGKADEHLRELDQRFASMHRRSEGERPPDVVVTARRLTYLLGRLPLPLDAYVVSAVAEHGTLQPRKALAQVRETPKHRFTGRWALLYETDWAGIRGALTQLFTHIEADHPKYWEIIATVERARRERTRLLIRCGSRTEARALGPALVADGIITLDELLDENGWLDIAWFGRQSPPLDYGPSGGRLLTVITEAPPPYRASLYTSAEKGGVEAILFPVEAARLRRNAARAAAVTGSAEGNAKTIAALMQYTVAPVGEIVTPVVTTLPSNAFTGRKPVKPVEPISDATARMMDFFDELDGLPELGAADNGPGAGPGGDEGTAGTRVLVMTTDGIGVFLDPAGEADVVQRDRLNQMPMRDLRPGMQLALVDGGERRGLLERLLEAWDNAFGPARVFYELYRQAFQTAWEKTGGTDQKLGEALGVHASTVRSWRTGDQMATREDEVLLRLLEISEMQTAIDNAPKIRHFLGRVRGMHRLIGRVFNNAAAEAAVSDEGEARAQLEALTGLDLRDFFDSVQVMTVERIVPADDVPHSLTGRFLPLTDPHVQKALT
jgi:hypothetical protein